MWEYYTSLVRVFFIKHGFIAPNVGQPQTSGLPDRSFFFLAAITAVVAVREVSLVALDSAQGSRRGILTDAYAYTRIGTRGFPHYKVAGMAGREHVEFSVGWETYSRVRSGEKEEYWIAYYEHTESLVEIR